MTKFKVGDKVRILDVKSIDFGRKFWLNGDVTKVTDVEVDGGVYLATPCSKGRGLYVTKAELRYIDLVPHSSTRNQRLTDTERTITTLESEVAELKAKVEALEKAQSKPKYTLDGLLSQVKPSPNEQRKAIIAEAKAFVEKYSGIVRAGTTPYTTESGGTIVKLFVNEKKRTVTAIPHLVHVNFDDVDYKKFAKCAPDDVFNADIGKAIALGRALGLDVSRFEQAVKPTEVVVGQVVHKTQGVLKGSVGPVTSVGDPSFMSGENGLTFAGDKSLNGDYVWSFKEDVEIIDDTEAVY